MDDLLDIPPFLRREKGGGTVELPVEKPAAIERSGPELTHRLHLRDQLPTIGSGFRMVNAHVGRKWVKIRSECGRFKARMRVPLWEDIKKEEL